MNTRGRSPVPPGAAGWLVLAVALAPVALQAAKPVTKKIAKGLIKLGEKLRDSVEDIVDASASTETAAEEHGPCVETVAQATGAEPKSEAEEALVVDAEAVQTDIRPLDEKRVASDTKTRSRKAKQVKAMRAKRSEIKKKTAPVGKRLKNASAKPRKAAKQPEAESGLRFEPPAGSRFTVPDDLDTA